MSMRTMSIIFNQPDILFNILICIPQKDLLLAQRVCKQWRHTISSSLQLQTVLFLAGPTITPTRPDDDDFQPNPLLQQHFPLFFKQRHYMIKDTRAQYSLFHPWYGTPWYNDIMAETQGQQYKYAMTSDRFSRPEASWRRMVPCYPVPMEIQLRHNERLSGAVYQVLQFPSQQMYPDNSPMSHVTFGILYDIVEEAWCRDLKCTNTINPDCVYNRVVGQFRVSLAHGEIPQSFAAIRAGKRATDGDGASTAIDENTKKTSALIDLTDLPIRCIPANTVRSRAQVAEPTDQDKVAFRSQASVTDTLEWDICFSE